MKKFFLTTVLFLFFAIINVYAQEYISGISCNTEIKKFLQNNPDFSLIKKTGKSSLELPFWDDFSQTEIFPDFQLWQDNYVYINSTLAEYPPSIGIATFDAADSKGEIYSYAGYETPFSADVLTSQPINLNYPGNETVYLSFYYQPQGIVEAPELADSLILEFFAPEENKWTKSWYSEGYSNTGVFKCVIIPVNEDKYLMDGFKFRFTNYASLGSATNPSLAVNCDFWHIDYVYLNKNRNINDTIFDDIAFNNPMNSLLKNYEAVPWMHYKSSSNIELADFIEVKYKNNGNQIGVIDSLNFRLSDLSGNAPVQFGYGGNNIINPFYQYTFLYNEQPFYFEHNENDFCDFLFTSQIVTSSSDSSQNNALNYTQKFRDYYAYDDGSAEAGYGIVGNGSKFGSVAYYFDPVKDDFLRGVYMYFTHAYNDASQKYFWLNVWSKGENNLPDTLIISLEGKLPEYSDELNQFVYYEFEEPVLLTEPFFIGWTQTTEDKLNIGFDLNKTANQNLYYNITDSWVQSSIQGAVMIRPVMGDKYTEIIDNKNDAITIYPNPAHDKIFFRINQNTQILNIQIIDLQGRLIKDFYKPGELSINIADLPNGIYFIKFNDLQGLSTVKKFLKN